MTNAASYNAWWQELSEKLESDLAGAQRTVDEGEAMLAEIRAFGGYPWERTFDTVVRVYAAAFRTRDGLEFIARHHPKPAARGTTLENFLGEQLTAHRRAGRIDQAREVLALMRGDECTTAFPEAERRGYLHRLRYEQAELDLAAGDVGACIAFYEGELKSYRKDPGLLVKLAFAYVAAGQIEDALARLAEAYAAAGHYREVVESWREWAPFVASAAYQAKFPIKKLPEDPVLADAYRRADDDPYRAWERLETEKDQTADERDRLGIQLFCLTRICSDLDEHGEENLWLYGGGEVTPAEFAERREAVAKALRALGPGEVPFWDYVGWRPDAPEGA